LQHRIIQIIGTLVLAAGARAFEPAEHAHGAGVPLGDSGRIALRSVTDDERLRVLDLEPTPDDGTLYRLPWRCGTMFRCTAGNEEGHHRAGTKSQHAYDFGVPSGTQLVAARGGIVTWVYSPTGPGDACHEGCSGMTPAVCEEKCLTRWNGLNIQHEDGTVGHYGHLEKVLVSEGQTVEQGELIGLSGDTGFSTGPHLHFMVMVRGCARDVCQSLPIKFAEDEGPESGDFLLSRNCVRPAKEPAASLAER
jgi:murein DD-endopeptidase MepM/ murein hydrolase activator NlpD